MGEVGGAGDYKVRGRGGVSVTVERRPWELVALRLRGLRPPVSAGSGSPGSGAAGPLLASPRFVSGRAAEGRSGAGRCGAEERGPVPPAAPRWDRAAEVGAVRGPVPSGAEGGAGGGIEGGPGGAAGRRPGSPCDCGA